MKRFVTLDFLRGFAILMMVVFHVPMRWYDRSWMDDGSTVEVAPLTLVLLLCVMFFGAWAGFFLLVSATSNQISMVRNLEKGKGPGQVVLKQVLGGTLLLVAAFIVESTIGYHGYLGELVLGNNRWDMVLWRGFHMETIHTIALCVIINGAVQGLLSIKGGHKKVWRNVSIYIVLALAVLSLTSGIFQIARCSYPGYPFRDWSSDLIGRDIPIQYPVIGETPIGEVGARSVLMVVAGAPEPLFPYLAISFLGSAIGTILCDRKKAKSMPRFAIPGGSALILVGFLGSSFRLASGRSDIRDLSEHFFELPGLYPDLWLWWFLFLTGSFIVSLMLVMRLVEYRGRSGSFADKTLWIRRYGFVAFTVYTYQFIDVLPRLGLGLLPSVGGDFPSKMEPLPVLALVVLTVLLWELVLRSWERIDYFLGMEWTIAKVSELFMPSRKKPGRRWYQVSRLDAREYLYDPQWLDIVKKEEMKKGEDSRLALIMGVISLAFPVLSIPALMVSRSAARSDGPNGINRSAMFVSALSIGIWSVVIIALVLAPPVVL